MSLLALYLLKKILFQLSGRFLKLFSCFKKKNDLELERKLFRSNNIFKELEISQLIELYKRCLKEFDDFKDYFQKHKNDENSLFLTQLK